MIAGVFRMLGAVAAAAWLLAQPAGDARAQPKGPPNALQGFSQNRDQPVQIDAARLEVRDKNKTAVFSGNVRVVQGDTTMLCQSLVVFYEQGISGKRDTLSAATPGPGGQQRIRKLEARGKVKVTQKDQTATGDIGIFDMPTNTVTLRGHVIMTQGKNVLRGDRLVVNLTSGVSRVESGADGYGRVQGLFQPGSVPRDKRPGYRPDRNAQPPPGRLPQPN